METREEYNTHSEDVEEELVEKRRVQVIECDAAYECWPCVGGLLKLGYEFNAQGRLCDKSTGEVAVLKDPNPDDIEGKIRIARLLTAIRNEIPTVFASRFSMKFIKLPLEKGCEGKQNGFLIASADLTTNQSGLVVLIEGFGTAGQWDPMLVLSEGLELGSQLWCVSKCINRGWAVLIMDASCSCTSRKNVRLKQKAVGEAEDRERGSDYGGYDTKCLHFCWGSCLQKLVDIWERFVLGLSVQKVAIIAHRCGGLLAENILKSAAACDRLKAVCLSDWTLSAMPCEAWWHMAVPRTRHWVPSARPCGAREKTRNGVRCASAGTKDPRRIPSSAADDMLGFIREMFDSDLGNVREPHSLPTV
ncbi:Uncharacterized protein Tcan_08705 [Toxocara canis]|uniref:Arb2 domain-containing protein n=1 Tax=Toxocara canis TaxID=6265 RepID=A0A0B2VEH3_TOXCA|nr:Uncharacterized protein Tcan_08705 [Toxocara canis]